jgi:[acyl-carrier-protein] S-malonyltransferase
MVLLPGVGEAECLRVLREHGIRGLVVACVNAPDEVIVSGRIDAVEELLNKAPVRTIRLPVPYAAHHPEMEPVAKRFLAGLRDVCQRPLRTVVHSPVRRRAYTDHDDLRRGLADCVTKPVRLPETLNTLGSGHPFVEIGMGNALVRCVQRTLPGARTIAPLKDDAAFFFGASTA